MVEKANKKLFKDEEPNIKIGATLKLARKEQNKTLLDVSQAAGVSQSFISKLENDRIKANLNHIRGILDDLKIKEEIFQVSQDMKKWYEDLLDYYLDLGDGNLNFKDVTECRDDFQSKIIELALDIKKGLYGNSEKNITLLITSMDTMKPIEVSIFLLIVSEYYIQIHEYFKAADLIDLVYKKAFVHIKIDLWLHELMFKLALCSKNEHYVTKIFLKLQEMYISFNLYGKSTEKRMEYLKHCTYLKDENFFTNLLSFDASIEHRFLQMINWYFNDKTLKLGQAVEQKPNEVDRLVHALYLHKTRKIDTLDLLVQHLETQDYDSPIELFYKQFLRAIYIDKAPESYLKMVLGSKSELYYHAPVIELASNHYIEYLMDAHRYKECTQVMRIASLRLQEIQKNLEIF